MNFKKKGLTGPGKAFDKNNMTVYITKGAKPHQLFDANKRHTRPDLRQRHKMGRVCVDQEKMWQKSNQVREQEKGAKQGK